MRGIINYLVGNSESANKLRNKFVFKIVPMLNPDGKKYLGQTLSQQDSNILKYIILFSLQESLLATTGAILRGWT